MVDDNTHPLPVPGNSMAVHNLRESKEGRAFLLAMGLWDAEQPRDKRRDAGPRKSYKVPPKSLAGPFVGWDGEGVTQGQKHRYVLMANSEGDTLYNPKGLNTVKTLDWLCDTAAKYPRGNHVMFGGSYDANMILGGLGFYQLSELANRGVLYVHKFRLEYRPRKFFRITRYIPGSRPMPSTQTGGLTLWDTIGFFQTSFVKALRGWFPERGDIIDAIERMKGRRSTFTTKEIAEVKAYCISECKLLAELMDTMRAHMTEVDVVPYRWDGAGAIAGIMLQRQKVKQHKPNYTVDKSGTLHGVEADVNLAARYAYFGGRIELVRFGNHEQTCYAHDIVSAYPSVMPQLPCLTCGDWEYRGPGDRTTDIPEGSFTVWHLRFDAAHIRQPFYPLPWRSESGLVYFPPVTQGWYWEPEAALLRDYYPHNHEILEAWTYHPKCEHVPFDFIRPVFDYRQRLKGQGHHGATVLKLGLNSLYGKLAQQVGWQLDRKTGTRKPPAYHCLEWAGWITSNTRARLFRLAMRHPESVIAFETDGLYSSHVHVDEVKTYTDETNGRSPGLGAWEVTEYPGLTYVQSGVYWTQEPDGTWKPKYRGLDPPNPTDPDAFTRDRVVKEWYAIERGESRVMELPVQQTRFRGMMTSTVSQERYCQWRQWVTERRLIRLEPWGKRIHSPADCPRCRAGSPDGPSRLHETMPTGGGTVSTPHPLAWIAPGPKTLEADEYYRAEMAMDEEGED